MILAQLPIELLDAILSFRPASLSLELLWCCGNVLLNTKLASGLTYVHMEQVTGFGPPRPHSLPSILPNLSSLRHLSLTASIISSTAANWSTLTLPPTLESLELDSLDAFLAIMNFSPSWTKEKYLFTSTQFERGPSYFVDVGKRFPRLRDLSLPQCLLAASDLAALPETLTRLTAREVRVTQPEKVLLWPRSLRFLEAVLVFDFPAPYHGVFAQDMSFWPSVASPELETIKTVITAPIGVLCNDASWLPRTLKRAPFTAIYTLKIARTLPPLLEDLTFASINLNSFVAEAVNWWEELPKNLTKLSVSNLPSLPSLAMLPQGLTELDLNTLTTPWHAYKNDAIRKNASKIQGGKLPWPPLLRHLITSEPGMDASHLLLLPSTLQALRLHILHTNPSTSFDMAVGRQFNVTDLPPNLTDLTLDISKRILELIGLLPSSLTRLQVVENGQRDGKIWAICVASFPASLTDLQARIWSNPIVSGRLDLSKTNLTSVEISHWHCDNFLKLPRTATVVYITKLDLEGTAYDLDHDDLFQNLPPLVVKLVLNVSGGAPRKELSSTSFSSLHKLKSLTVNFNGTFPSRIIRHWPRRMSIAHIPLTSMQFDDLPFLPPLLHQYDFKLER